MKILVVDDDLLFRSIISGFCEMLDYEFYGITDGDQASAVAVFEKVDLIFLDIFMENKEGLQTLAELKQYTHAPIVMVSSDEFYLDVALGMGADAIAVKPVIFEEFKTLAERYGTGEDRFNLGAESERP